MTPLGAKCRAATFLGDTRGPAQRTEQVLSANLVAGAGFEPATFGL
jgi:hypothetical protein